MGRGNTMRRKIAGMRAKRGARERKAEGQKEAARQKFKGGWVLLRYCQQSRRAKGVYTAEGLYHVRPETDAPFAAMEKTAQARMATAPGWIEGPALAELPMDEYERGVEYRVLVGPADKDGKPRKAILVPAVDGLDLRGPEGAADSLGGRVVLTEGTVSLGKIAPAAPPPESETESGDEPEGGV